MKTILEKIENLNVNFWGLVVTFLSAIFIRDFLENFINLNNLGTMNNFSPSFLHYPLWYLVVFLGLTVIISLFSGKEISKVIKLVSLGSFIITLPVIIDLLFYRHRIVYEYIVGSWPEIFEHYYTFLINNESFGVGIKTEIFIVIFFIFYYVFLQKKSLLKSLGAALFSYSFIFLMLILPNVVYFIAGLFQSLPPLSPLPLEDFFYSVNYNSHFVSERTYLFNTTYFNLKYDLLKNLFATVMAQSAFYILILLGGISFFIHFGFNKVIYLFGNFRWLRIIHYLMLFLFGIMISQKAQNFVPHFFNIYDWLAFLSAVLALVFAWLFAVWENDEVDLTIDQASNSNRPLVKNIFSKVEWKNMKWLFFAFSLICATLSGYYTFSTIIVFIIVYHLYSCPPLRLKRYPVISSALISLNACLAFLIGFFLVSGVRPFDILPVGILSGLFIFYLFVENIKNLKDIAGDEQDNILTIPVIFGERRGKIITWLLVFIGSFAIPFLIFPDKTLSVLGPVLGALSYFLIVKEDYKEKPVMLLYLISFIVLLSL